MMPTKDPKKKREYSRKYNAAHREEVNERQRKYRAQNPEKARESNRKWRVADPEKVRESIRKSHLKRKYGLTPEEYDAMVTVQLGLCAICERGDEQLHVDHNHATGTVRGLLCHGCNKAVGFLHDSPDLLRKAANYLEL
jgi:hypothetical protein